MANTAIEWCDKVWNPARGCNRVSEGCSRCYAMGQAHRFAGQGGKYEGLTTIRRGKVDWTGHAVFVPEMLAEPLRWRKPQRVFVNSMSDLFHHSLTNEEIAAVFGVMAAAPQHTFQVLTKRPERAREWFAWYEEKTGTKYSPCGIASTHAAQRLGRGVEDFMPHLLIEWPPWPLPNVWLGVSVENQETADKRIPLLLQTPAAVRFVSYEPALGPIKFTSIEWCQANYSANVAADIDAPEEPERINALDGSMRDGEDMFRHRYDAEYPKLDWIIVGGESGHGARPFDVVWARSVVEQCRAAGVACFVKQLGARPFNGLWTLRGQSQPTEPNWIKLHDKKGGDWSEWPDDLKVRQFPRSAP